MFEALLQRLGYQRIPAPAAVEDRYGDDNTIHGSTDVNVELGPNGEVCAVWFRCRLVPFTESRVDERRASVLCADYSVGDGVKPIKAIVFGDW